MSHEHEAEPIPGLPGRLPPGEQILWQGQPSWRGLWRDAFLGRWLSLYFALFLGARGLAALRAGHSVFDALWACLSVLPLPLLCIGVLALLAWLNARASLYTITNRRVVMRIGVAIPVSFNLPFQRLAEANLRRHADGTADIALTLAHPDRIAWLHLWPHSRPFRMAKAQPMLRAIVQGEQVAALLAQAVTNGAIRSASTSPALAAPAAQGNPSAGSNEQGARPTPEIAIAPTLGAAHS